MTVFQLCTHVTASVSHVLVFTFLFCVVFLRCAAVIRSTYCYLHVNGLNCNKYKVGSE
ncbi:hypothetical protein BDZ94DRAFT_795675 [Collybia nuda]|uniref:Uncharacterized protein n=1 Tax=Collybia nuda TaxID=64659 RepID=A0A9P5Y3X2_9AGAR|nr:hypothetical protein BDZ94DRAFT_795675 [Collybia nuda]